MMFKVASKSNEDISIRVKTHCSMLLRLSKSIFEDVRVKKIGINVDLLVT